MKDNIVLIKKFVKMNLRLYTAISQVGEKPLNYIYRILLLSCMFIQKGDSYKLYCNTWIEAKVRQRVWNVTDS